MSAAGEACQVRDQYGGYGNISPATFWGRLVVLAYATIGIPLTLLMLANIGDVMADVFRFVYAKLCCCGILNRKDKDEVERVSINSKGPTPEAWPSNYPDQEAEGHLDQVEEEEEEEEDEEEEEAPVSVPLTVTVGLLCGYLLMGSVMFSAWEGWEPLAAAYFSYVTISTVGFGDLVPSTNYETAGDVGRLLGSALYIIFGLALLSMCFALIQEEIECKAAWLKERFGKKKEAEEEGEEAEEEGRKSSRENAETGEKESPSPTMDKEKIY